MLIYEGGDVCFEKRKRMKQRKEENVIIYLETTIPSVSSCRLVYIPMEQEGIPVRATSSQRTVYNLDQLIQSYSSLDEEQVEIDKKMKRMIVPSVDKLYREPSVFNSFPLPIGFIFQPFVLGSRDCLQVNHSPVRCARCKVIASNISTVESNGNWKCAFCATVSSSPYNNQYINKNKKIDIKEEYGELNANVDTVEFAMDSDNTPSLYSPSSSSRAVLFLIDKSLSSIQFNQIRESLSTILDDPLCEDYYIGLIVFGDVVEIYELEGCVGTADVYSGTHLPSPSDEAYIRRHELFGSDRQVENDDLYSSYLSPLRGHEQHVLDILSTFTTKEEK